MVTTGRIMDCLANAVARYKYDRRRGIDWTWDYDMTSEEHVAFDLFLVKTGDQLAYQAGTAENRFRARVMAMALNRPAVNDYGCMDTSDPRS